MSKGTPKGQMPAWYSPVTATLAAAGEGAASRYTHIHSECPCLLPALEGDVDEKGHGRPPMKLKLFVEGGRLKVSLDDAANKRSGFMTLDTTGSLGEVLERALECDGWDWRLWGSHKKK